LQTRECVWIILDRNPDAHAAVFSIEVCSQKVRACRRGRELPLDLAGDSMNELVRNMVDLSFALVTNLLAIVLDTSLLSIFIAHIQGGCSDRRIRDWPSKHSKQAQRGFSIPKTEWM